MLSLHAVTELFRSLFKWGIVVIGVLVLLFFGVKFGSFVKDRLNPQKPTEPTVSFGKLPQPLFPANVSAEQFSYTIDTVSGKLPRFPDRLVVYPVVQNKPNLLSLERAKDKVASIGFTGPGGAVTPETKISDIVYVWNDTKQPSRKIEMDIVTYDFTLTSSFMTDTQVLSGQFIPGEESAKEEATDFFNTLDTVPPDIELDKAKVEYFSITNGALSPAAGRANAQIARVDLFQKSVEKIPVVYPKPPYSTMSVLLGSGRNDPVVVEATYLHQAIDTTKKTATYPIKTSDQAFEELKSGKAHILNYFGSSSSISLKNIYVGYYLSDKRQQYAYPVVVFEGDGGFVAYVSLIEDEWFL